MRLIISVYFYQREIIDEIDSISIFLCEREIIDGIDNISVFLRERLLMDCTCIYYIFSALKGPALAAPQQNEPTTANVNVYDRYDFSPDIKKGTRTHVRTRV